MATGFVLKQDVVSGRLSAIGVLNSPALDASDPHPLCQTVKDPRVEREPKTTS